MKEVGSKVKLHTGKYAGLNYENLVVHGWTPDTLIEITEIDERFNHPYLIKLPDGTKLRISDRDIKGI